MSPLDQTDWEILDATADDWENLEQIYLAVCFEVVDLRSDTPPRTDLLLRRARPEILLREIADRTRGLVERGLLTAINEDDGRPVTDRGDPSYVWKAWFRMTPEGKRLWEASDYATSVEREQPQ
jgi:hypothetical protein